MDLAYLSTSIFQDLFTCTGAKTWVPSPSEVISKDMVELIGANSHQNTIYRNSASIGSYNGLAQTGDKPLCDPLMA